MQDGFERNEPGLMPSGQWPAGKKTSKPNMRHAVIMMVVGCVCCFLIPFLGAFFFGFGARELIEIKGKQGIGTSALVGIVAAAIATVLFGPGAFSSVISLLACATGVAWCMKRGATVNNVSAVVVASAAVSMGLVAIYCATQGTTLAQAASATMIEAAAAYVGEGVEAEALLAQITPILSAIWPLTYVMSAVFNTGFAAVGSHLMSARSGGKTQMAPVQNFDMPLWPVGVLALSVVGLGVSFADFPGATVVLSISVTALLAVRVIFALQGFGVMVSVLNKYRLGCAGRMLVIFLALWLETMLFVVSIVGLIDVWANFRKLPRGGSAR